MILLEWGGLWGENPDHLVQFRNLFFIVNKSLRAPPPSALYRSPHIAHIKRRMIAAAHRARRLGQTRSFDSSDLRGN